MAQIKFGHRLRCHYLVMNLTGPLTLCDLVGQTFSTTCRLSAFRQAKLYSLSDAEGRETRPTQWWLFLELFLLSKLSRLWFFYSVFIFISTFIYLINVDVTWIQTKKMPIFFSPKLFLSFPGWLLDISTILWDADKKTWYKNVNFIVCVGAFFNPAKKTKILGVKVFFCSFNI